MDKNPFVILGIDPGSVITGYAILSLAGTQIQVLDFGCIRLKGSFEEKCKHLFQGVDALCKNYQPQALAIEDQFVHKNVKSALKLVMAKTACILAVSLQSIPVFEYSPSSVKKAILGSGRASKEKMQWMLQQQLHLSSLPKPSDAADALGIALCHLRRGCYV